MSGQGGRALEYFPTHLTAKTPFLKQPEKYVCVCVSYHMHHPYQPECVADLSPAPLVGSDIRW